ncbi:MAG: CDC27 family protein [Bdellovibrionota bacterium]
MRASMTGRSLGTLRRGFSCIFISAVFIAGAPLAVRAQGSIPSLDEVGEVGEPPAAPAPPPKAAEPAPQAPATAAPPPVEGASARLQLSAEAVKLRVQVLLSDREYNNAGKMLQAYLKRKPNDQEAQLLFAQVFEGLKRYELALKALDKAGETRGVHLVRSRILFKQDNFDGAMKEAELSAAAGNPDGYHFLGYLQVVKKDYEKALPWFEKADKEGTTKYVANHYYWGQALYYLKRYDEAEKHLQVAQREGRGTDYVKPSEDLLDVILSNRGRLTRVPESQPEEEEKEGARKWKAYLQLAVEYDSNTTLLPDGQPAPSSSLPGKEDGIRNVLAGHLDAELLRKTDWAVMTSADATFAYDYLVKHVQLFSFQGGVLSPVGFRIGPDPASITPFGLIRVVYYGKFTSPRNSNYQLGFGDEGPFSKDLEPGLRLLWKHNERYAFSLAGSYINSSYTDQVTGSAPQSDRNSHNIRVTLMEIMNFDFMREKDFTLNAFFTGAYRKAKDADFSYFSGEIGVDGDLKIDDLLIGEGGLVVRHENYFDSPSSDGDPLPEQRKDWIINFNLGGRYQLHKEKGVEYWALLKYFWDHNFSSVDVSSTVLSYDKHVISLGIRADF